MSELAQHFERLHRERKSSAEGRDSGRSGDAKQGQPREDLPLRAFIDLLKSSTGKDFGLYKPGTLQRRIERRMALNGVQGWTDYLALLRKSPAETDALARDLLINVTGFFRDPEAFARSSIGSRSITGIQITRTSMSSSAAGPMMARTWSSVVSASVAVSAIARPSASRWSLVRVASKRLARRLSGKSSQIGGRASTGRCAISPTNVAAWLTCARGLTPRTRNCAACCSEER